MLFETGSYTGNGTSQTISLNEITGTPDLVFVCRSSYGCFKTSSMASDLTLRFGSANTYTTAITSFGAGQFSLGSSFLANASGVTYHYVAFQDDGGGDFLVGSYTGSAGADDRQISGVGFQPECVMVFKHGAAVDRFHTDSMGASTDSSPGLAEYTAVANYIQDLTVPASDGFEVGTLLNTDAINFYYVAFKPVANFIDSLRWTGDGVDNTDKTVTANGGTPEFCMIKDSGGYYGAWRAEESGRGHSGDAADYFRGGLNNLNQIQSTSPDTVQIGNSNNTNASGRTYDLFWVITNPASAGGNAPTSHLYGPLVGCLGGPI